MAQVVRTRGYALVEVVKVGKDGEFSTEKVEVPGKFTSENGVRKALKHMVAGDDYIVRSIENHRREYAAQEDEFWKIAKPTGEDKVVDFGAPKVPEDNKNNKNNK